MLQKIKETFAIYYGRHLGFKNERFSPGPDWETRKRKVENTITECVKKGHLFPSGVERRGLFGEGKGICLTEGTFKEE